MSLAALLGVRPGLTALIGGGGKTSLLYALADELKTRGRVIVASSAKIRRPSHLPTANPDHLPELTALLRQENPLCLGSPWPEDKLAAPALPFAALIEAADFVLVEADGSRGLPAKAHAAHEPVIPAEARLVVLVLGADAFARPIKAVCHRPERFAALAGCSPNEPLSPSLWARVIREEGYGNIIYVNKCETESDWRNAAELARLVELPLVAGSLRQGQLRAL